MHGGSCSATVSCSGERTWTIGVATRAGFSRTTSSVDRCTEPRARHEPRGNADDQNDRYQDERTSPRLLMPLVVRADGVGEDLERESGDGLAESRRPELVAESGEEQWRGLSGD